MPSSIPSTTTTKKKHFNPWAKKKSKPTRKVHNTRSKPKQKALATKGGGAKPMITTDHNNQLHLQHETTVLEALLTSELDPANDGGSGAAGSSASISEAAVNADIRSLNAIIREDESLVTEELVRPVLELINTSDLNTQELAILTLAKLSASTVLELAKNEDLDEKQRLSLILAAEPDFFESSSRTRDSKPQRKELYTIISKLLMPVFKSSKKSTSYKIRKHGLAFMTAVFDNNRYLRIAPVKGMGRGVFLLPRTDKNETSIFYTGTVLASGQSPSVEEQSYVMPFPLDDSSTIIDLVGTADPLCPALAASLINDRAWNPEIEGFKNTVISQLSHSKEVDISSMRKLITKYYDNTIDLSSDTVKEDCLTFGCIRSTFLNNATEATQLSRKYGTDQWFSSYLETNLSKYESYSQTVHKAMNEIYIREMLPLLDHLTTATSDLEPLQKKFMALDQALAEHSGQSREIFFESSTQYNGKTYLDVYNECVSKLYDIS